MENGKGETNGNDGADEELGSVGVLSGVGHAKQEGNQTESDRQSQVRRRGRKTSEIRRRWWFVSSSQSEGRDQADSRKCSETSVLELEVLIGELRIATSRIERSASTRSFQALPPFVQARSSPASFLSCLLPLLPSSSPTRHPTLLHAKQAHTYPELRKKHAPCLPKCSFLRFHLPW